MKIQVNELDPTKHYALKSDISLEREMIEKIIQSFKDLGFQHVYWVSNLDIIEIEETKK